MADLDLIAYNTAAFICALFVLEFGADKFIDHTAILAKRTGISQTVIALLTAGAEWEELAVVVISIARHRPCLAYGNIIGSTISNILGAFSLGLLFHAGGSDVEVFDQSSKLYSAVLLGLTCLVTLIVVFGDRIIGKAIGGVAIAVFMVYLISIGWAISRGTITAPELSDSDSDTDDSDEDQPQATDRTSKGRATVASGGENADRTYDTFHNSQSPRLLDLEQPLHSDQTMPDDEAVSVTNTTDSNVPLRRSRHSVAYHLTLLILGFLSLTLSAYVLSTSAGNLATALGLSDLLFGVVILSLATTLPEKLVAVLSGARGHTGIMVANTVGSNIFLLTLCLGILWVATDGGGGRDCIGLTELGVMAGATAWMTVIIWIGGRRWVRVSGGAMLVAYVAFVVLESVRA